VRALTPPEGGLGRARVGLSHIPRQGPFHRIHAEEPNREGGGRLEQNISAAPGEGERGELRPVGDVVHDRGVAGDHQAHTAVEGIAGIETGRELKVDDRAAANERDGQGRIGKEVGSGIRRGLQGDLQPIIPHRDCGVYAQVMNGAGSRLPAGHDVGRRQGCTVGAVRALTQGEGPFPPGRVGCPLRCESGTHLTAAVEPDQGFGVLAEKKPFAVVGRNWRVSQIDGIGQCHCQRLGGPGRAGGEQTLVSPIGYGRDGRGLGTAAGQRGEEDAAQRGRF